MPNIDRIEGFADELTAIRRDLHAHPEIGFEEVRTSGIVADKLTQWGIEVHRGLGGTGVVGVLKGKGNGGKRIGLRADMDALPMEENTNLRWRSTIPGRFHGCGHDGHTTMLLGTARYLAETRNFDGTVHFIFQPAEEGLGGARAMIKDGLFEKFPCDEIYGLHNAPDLNHGEIAILPGAGHGRRRLLRHHHQRLRRARRDAGTLKGSGHDRDDAWPGAADHRQPQRRSACSRRCCRSPRSMPAPPTT